MESVIQLLVIGPSITLYPRLSLLPCCCCRVPAPRSCALFPNVVTDCWSPNFQTIDTNSAYFAKYCFSLGIQLKRVEVIADDENEIIEAVGRMSNNYDFVVTSGGIGPTSVYPILFSRKIPQFRSPSCYTGS